MSSTVQKEPQLEDRIRDYWDRRAVAFGSLREAELDSVRATRWMAEFHRAIKKPGLRILDIGTGAGFFAVLLGREGHQVTGIDLSPQMIEEAKRFAAKHGVAANFAVMDAMATTFADQSFDVIVTRNLTWTLPDVAAAYAEWTRLLVPGGVLVNFDANYGPVSFAKLTEDLEKDDVKNAHRDIEKQELLECDAIKAELSVSKEARPAYDVKLLNALGYTVEVDETLSDRIYPEHDETWNPIAMFSIVATKAE